MSKKFRFGIVASIILALVSPASPASNADAVQATDFTAQSASLTVEVLYKDDPVPVQSSVDLQIKNGEQFDNVDWASSEGGETQFSFGPLDPGEYRLFANPWVDGLAVASSFDVVVADDNSISMAVEGQPSQTISAFAGVFQLPTYEANVYFPVLNPDGTMFEPIWDEFGSVVRLGGHLEQLSTDDVWVRAGNVEMYYFEEELEGGDWVVTEAGIKVRVPEAGETYRVVVRPEGLAGAAETVSPSFSVADVGQIPEKLDPVTLGVPALEVQVVAPGQLTPIFNSYVRVFKLDESVQDFSNGDFDAPIAVLFDSAGVYEIEVGTNNSEFSDLAKVVYTVDVTEVDGQLIGAVRGETAVEGVYYLELQAANFILNIVDPDDSAISIQHAEARIHEASGTQRGNYVTNAWSQNGSNLSFNLADGNYYVETNPNDGNYLLASNSYLVGVSGSSVTVTTLDGEPRTATNGVFRLAVAKANVVGKVVDASGNPVVVNWDQRKWVSVNLMSVTDTNIEWLGNSNVDDQGRFSFRVTEAGDYRVEIRPEGYPDSANLNVDFSITPEQLSSLTELGSGDPAVVTLPQPDIRVAVRVPSGSENLKNVSVEIFQGYEYVTSSFSGQSGIAGLTFPTAGDYEIRINPPRSATGTARASYSANLSIAGDPAVRTVTVKDSSGVTLSATDVSGSDVYILTLGVPTLSGTVTSPDQSQLMRDVEVVPVNRETGWEMWEYSARTNSFGVWSMALPEGTWDVYARAPWGDASFGDGDRIGPVVVDASGVATSLPTGYTAEAFDLSLNSPTWSGVMVSPQDPNTVITNGNVCLVIVTEQSHTWNCAQTNGLGEWALSKPTGFAGFSENDELVIEQWSTSEFAPKRLRGVAAIEAVLGEWVDGGEYTGLEVSPALPNLKVFVQAGTDVNGNPAPARNAWVGVDDGMEWLGGASTNSQGFAMISIPDDKLTSALNIQVNVEHNATLSEKFAGLRYEASEDLSATAPREISLALLAPNLRVDVLEPGTSNPVTYSWIEVLNEATNEWLGGTNTNRNGFAALTLPATGTYTVTVNPPWDGGADFGKRAYTVTVDGGGNVTAVTAPGGTDVNADLETGVYGLQLSVPSVRGVVKNSSGVAIRDSWITPIEQNGWEYLWWMGTNSRSGGEFAMDLSDGIYLLEANPSWSNTTGDTKSKRCSIEVAGSNLNTGYAGADKCSIAEGKVQLQLRAPNVKFTLKAPDQSVVPFANVGMFLGGWSVWSQSNKDGLVAFNLDAAEIKERSGLTSAGTYDIRIVVEPPYGNSDLARFECNSTDAAQLCGNVPDFVLDGSLAPSFSSSLSTDFDALFAAPNTKLRIADPNGDPLMVRGSWVNIFEEGSGRSWLAAGGSDGSGYVSFNLDLTTPKTYTIEVNPPHNLRGVYAQATYSGLTHNALNGGLFDLSEPNFKLKLFDKDKANPAKWAWVGVEIVDKTTNSVIDWYGGSGTDRTGQLSLTLADDKRYKVLLNPGQGTAGSFTNCLFDVDIEGNVSQVAGSCDSLVTLVGDVWEIKLSPGNVTGEAYFMQGANKKLLGGAIVVANNGSLQVTTTTKADGTYSLQLENGTWTVEVFYVRKEEDPEFVSNKLSLTVTISDDQKSLNAVFDEAV